MADGRPERLRVVEPTPRVQLPTVEAVDQVPVDELPALVAELAALQARAAMRLRRDPVPTTDEDRLLTIDEAAARLALSKDWLRRRPELPFVVKLSEGVVRYSSRRLDAYIARHLRR
jgi:predicted DNA-binding transcriptional regulator AlpA